MSDQLDFELKLSAAVKVFATNADAPFDPSVLAASALADRNRGWRVGMPTIDLWRVAAIVGAVAVLAVAVAFTLNFLSNRPGVGPQPTEATPSIEPSPGPSEPPSPSGDLANANVTIATYRLEGFMAARVAGSGAEQWLIDSQEDVPLLYATTSGAPYERYEIRRVSGYCCEMTFAGQLFADGGATVVEQQIRWNPGEDLWVDVHTTTENGEPIPSPLIFEDGVMSLSAPSTWDAWLPGKVARDEDQLASDVWFGMLWRTADGPIEPYDSGFVGLVDPVAYDAWCAAEGGSPLLTEPANAAAIAQQLVADTNLETTEPVAARIGGLDAVSIDVALAPGGNATCGGRIVISRWIHQLRPDIRLRLYLVDLPVGMPVDTLAVYVLASEDRFDDVIAETAPIIESIEFHPDESTTGPSEVE